MIEAIWWVLGIAVLYFIFGLITFAFAMTLCPPDQWENQKPHEKSDSIRSVVFWWWIVLPIAIYEYIEERLIAWADGKIAEKVTEDDP